MFAKNKEPEQIEEVTKLVHEITLERLNKETGLPIPDEFKEMAKEPLTSIVFNKRPIPAGSIFYCAKGHKKHMNELDFDEVKRNAKLVVSEEPFLDCPTIKVKKALPYMLEAMKMIRKEMPNQIIAVTGSVGKTSCKGMIGRVLKEHFKSTLSVTAINNNTLSRIVGAMQNIDTPDKMLLQEVAIDSPSYKGCSAQILMADVAVFTNIKDNHIQQFKSRENIAAAKLALADCGNPDGLAVILYDDPLLMAHEYKQKVVTYSIDSPEADYYAKNIIQTEEGTSFDLVDNVENNTYPMKLSIIGEHNVLNALAAYAVARHYEIPVETIARGMLGYTTSGIRQNLMNFGKCRVLADCYNSSYEAVEFMLRSFDQIKVHDGVRKIAVLGDVFMLGNLTEEIHRNMGELVKKCKTVKLFVLVGEAMKNAYKVCGKKKSSKRKVVYFKTMNEAREYLKGEIKQDDFIFLKASNGMRFGEMLDSLFGSIEGEVELLGAFEFLLKDDEEGNNYYIFPEHSTLRHGSTKEKVEIADTMDDLEVRVVGTDAFKNHTNLQEIKLPAHLARLSTSCFENTGLSEVTFPDSLRQIAKKAFAECKELREVNLPDGLLVIGDGAFKNCKKLRKIHIGSDTQLISDNAFEGTPWLKRIICPKGSYAEKYARSHRIWVKCE